MSLRSQCEGERDEAIARKGSVTNGLKVDTFLPHCLATIQGFWKSLKSNKTGTSDAQAKIPALIVSLQYPWCWVQSYRYWPLFCSCVNAVVDQCKLRGTPRRALIASLTNRDSVICLSFFVVVVFFFFT